MKIRKIEKSAHTIVVGKVTMYQFRRNWFNSFCFWYRWFPGR